LNKNCPLDVIEAMHALYPSAIRATNNYGFLPVTYATSRTCDILRYLIREFPESVRHADARPFHSACRNGSFEAFEYLMSLYPEAVSVPTERGDFPLHFATQNSSCPDQLKKLKQLIIAYPEAARKAGSDGQLPLHNACLCFQPSLTFIREVFDVYPEAIHARDSKGRLPIHCAFDYRNGGAGGEVIRFLYNQLPYGIKTQDNDGQLPLHMACSAQSYTEEEMDTLEYVIELYPEAMKVDSPKYGLPLHRACGQNWKLDFIIHLLVSYPESLEYCNESIGLPLHCAHDPVIFAVLLNLRYPGQLRYPEFHCPFHAILQDKQLSRKSEVVQSLIKWFGINATDEDSRKVLPLHLAIRELVEFDVVKNLVDLNPATIAKCDSMGSLPLHYALRYGASFQMIEYLINGLPQGCVAVDNQGNLPLHLACRQGTDVETVQLLLSQFPDGAQMRDKHGFTPLHVACRHNKLSFEAVLLLIEANPVAVTTKSADGELPLHKACRGGHISLIKLLLDNRMASASERNFSGMLPVFCLCQSSGKRDQDIVHKPEFLETVWTLLRANPDAITCYRS